MNYLIDRLQLDNPTMIIHNVSHACVFLPKIHNKEMCIISATILYSGTIERGRGLHGFKVYDQKHYQGTYEVDL